MLWVGGSLVVVGVALAGRTMWVSRSRRTTGAHGLMLALGVSAACWGLLLLGVSALLD
ncbi:hypothetical protein GCM10023216_12420 [Isoptericola chiayiensis]|uniref:Uncharacterized protein n=1 Tax=Isoptericola chiayiensis TaxID=579446 RepID=A0ABP8YDF1_9MICO|nr:hypothetical protein [Isoptericola chiayiensis]NOW00879.1 hypothetical protein [Isoptericola chiayiensis]